MDRHGAPCYQFGPFRLNVSEHMLVRDGLPVPLTPKVFDVLRVLADVVDVEHGSGAWLGVGTARG